MDKIEPVSVRQKSSHRKQRAETLPRTQRPPAQKRSKQRREEILLAVEALLETVDIEDLSHADIATTAGVSRASVHYHFPTISSVQYEIGRRYDTRLAKVMQDLRDRLAKADVSTWHDWVRIEATAARDWFNAHRPACEALLGPLLTRKNRVAAMEDNARVGLSKLQNLCRLFEVPDEMLLASKIRYNGEMMDLFWSASYQGKGHIDDTALEESIRASVGFLRSFLPDVLPMREPAAA